MRFIKSILLDTIKHVGLFRSPPHKKRDGKTLNGDRTHAAPSRVFFPGTPFYFISSLLLFFSYFVYARVRVRCRSVSSWLGYPREAGRNGVVCEVSRTLLIALFAGASGGIASQTALIGRPTLSKCSRGSLCFPFALCPRNPPPPNNRRRRQRAPTFRSLRRDSCSGKKMVPLF